MEPTPAPKHYIGRILLINLGVVLVLHIGRQLLNNQSSILYYLLVLAAGNVMLGADSFIRLYRRAAAVYLLVALVVLLIGFGDCATHFHLDTR